MAGAVRWPDAADPGAVGSRLVDVVSHRACAGSACRRVSVGHRSRTAGGAGVPLARFLLGEHQPDASDHGARLLRFGHQRVAQLGTDLWPLRLAGDGWGGVRLGDWHWHVGRVDCTGRLDGPRTGLQALLHLAVVDAAELGRSEAVAAPWIAD